MAEGFEENEVWQSCCGMNRIRKRKKKKGRREELQKRAKLIG
jgi:hypothetical protein